MSVCWMCSWVWGWNDYVEERFSESNEGMKILANNSNNKTPNQSKTQITLEKYERLSRLLWLLDPIKTQYLCFAWLLLCHFKYSHNFDFRYRLLQFFFVCRFTNGPKKIGFCVFKHVKREHWTNIANTENIRVINENKGALSFGVRLYGIDRAENGKTTKRHFSIYNM